MSDPEPGREARPTPFEAGEPEVGGPATADPRPAGVDDVAPGAPDGAAAEPPADAEPGEPVELAGEDEEPSELADDAVLDAALESLLLVVDSPVTHESLASALREPLDRVSEALRRLSESYTAQRRGIDLRRTGEGWRFYTRDVYAPYVERFLTDGQRAKLTRAALETLAVIAYRQPVTRSRVAAVRGVNVDGVVRTLLTRGLIQDVGTDEETQGTLYRTTELFLERLGLSSLDELPSLAPLLPEVDAIDEL